MLDFEIFSAALRHVFAEFVGLKDLTSEAIKNLPDKYQNITSKIELFGEANGTLWLNISEPGVTLAMQKLQIPQSHDPPVRLAFPSAERGANG